VTDTIEELASGLNSTAIHLVRRLRRSDAALGVTPARLSALSVLVFGGPASLSQLAKAEQVAGPTMSKIVAGLEQSGLVRRAPDPDDGRSIRLSATAAGTRLMERGRRQRVKQLSNELRQLSPDQVRKLRNAVAILRSLEDGRGKGAPAAGHG
jgi:DNA-binding MarR family transcriptional regulator